VHRKKGQQQTGLELLDENSGRQAPETLFHRQIIGEGQVVMQKAGTALADTGTLPG
jgi:hypothetical protein